MEIDKNIRARTDVAVMAYWKVEKVKRALERAEDNLNIAMGRVETSEMPYYVSQTTKVESEYEPVNN